MELLYVFGMLILNFAISWFNAWAVGHAWADSKATGGWPRLLAWCGAIMSACGFTWCYLVVACMIAGAYGLLPPDYVRATMDLGYVVIILPILGSGLGIWIESVCEAWRRRDLASAGVAAWNTYAQAHNMYEAASALPGIFEHLGKVFDFEDADDAKGRLVLAVLLLVLASCFAGILTTAAILRGAAKEAARQLRAEMRAA